MREAISVKTIYFFSLLFTALTLTPLMAHLLELPNKINISREDYLTVQQNYRGWALTGIIIAGALLSNLILAIILRHERKPFIFALIALLSIVGTQVIFWTYTQPANVATNMWTMLPENWNQLRSQWEYSHAASAILSLIALVSLFLSVLSKR